MFFSYSSSFLFYGLHGSSLSDPLNCRVTAALQTQALYVAVPCSLLRRRSVNISWHLRLLQVLQVALSCFVMTSW